MNGKQPTTIGQRRLRLERCEPRLALSADLIAFTNEPSTRVEVDEITESLTFASVAVADLDSTGFGWLSLADDSRSVQMFDFHSSLDALQVEVQEPTGDAEAPDPTGLPIEPEIQITYGLRASDQEAEPAPPHAEIADRVGGAVPSALQPGLSAPPEPAVATPLEGNPTAPSIDSPPVTAPTVVPAPNEAPAIAQAPSSASAVGSLRAEPSTGPSGETPASIFASPEEFALPRRLAQSLIAHKTGHDPTGPVSEPTTFAALGDGLIDLQSLLLVTDESAVHGSAADAFAQDDHTAARDAALSVESWVRAGSIGLVNAAPIDAPPSGDEKQDNPHPRRATAANEGVTAASATPIRDGESETRAGVSAAAVTMLFGASVVWAIRAQEVGVEDRPRDRHLARSE